MAIEANKALVRRFYDEVINARNLDAIGTLLTPDFVHNGEARGQAGQRAAIETLFTAFPDMRAMIDGMVAEGDEVAARMTWRGTHQGPFMGIAPTGREISFASVVIMRIAGGRLAQAWITEDDLGILRQIGGYPCPD
jgi:steroid delta-isomerase-like uncharacterized protein